MSSLVSSIIQSLVEEGQVTHEFKIKSVSFKMSILTNEEQVLADSLVDFAELQKKYDAALNVMRDTVDKFRTLNQIAFAIKEVNGTSPVSSASSLTEQLKQRLAFREELMTFNVVMQDQLITEYRVLLDKQREFLKDIGENAGK